MKQSIDWPLRPADPSNFSGAAFMRLVGEAATSEPVKVYYVRFEPGARTNWHVHSGDQILLVTVGTCRYQITGQPPIDLPVGESVRIRAGTRHWHGAAPTESGEHVAINLDVEETTWLESVSDEEYAG
jgi:quercetin dioxygenase-like cupin family protein